jgi:hypothetical protein
LYDVAENKKNDLGTWLTQEARRKWRKTTGKQHVETLGIKFSSYITAKNMLVLMHQFTDLLPGAT